MDAPLVKQGDILAGTYRVDRVLGAGGMGVVVAATHVALGEPRALKFMRATGLSDGEAVERFLREARASSRLKGEHVAKVHDVGQLDDGAPYIVLELLSGQDLGEVLAERGRLPVGEALLYVLQACEALTEAHALGVVHRDLKPANLFLVRRPDGTPCIKVLDFGISKILGDHGDGHSVTKSYAILGSPHYMSPEQMRSSRDVDARTDVWSLGVIAYQLVSGELPFKGRTITEIITVVLQGTPDPPSSVVPGLPPGLDAAILRCLERDLDRRHASVAALAAALAPFAPPEAQRSIRAMERLLGSPLPAAAPPAPPGRAPSTWGATLLRLGTSNPGLVISGAAIGVALGLAAFELTGGVPAHGPASPTTSTAATVDPAPSASPPSPPEGR